MKCEKCGQEMERIDVNIFDRNGNDEYHKIDYRDISGAAVIELFADCRWAGKDVTAEEQKKSIRCPNCKQYPFKYREIEVEDVIQIVMYP